MLARAFYLLVLLALAAAWTSNRLALAADYYFSSAGSDILGAGTIFSPWQTISRLNSLDLNAGDSVYFRAGDTFPGNIVLDAVDSANSPLGVYGGSPITLGSYGIGNRPVISSPTGHGLRATNIGGLEIRGLEFAGTSVLGSLTSTANTTKGLFFENTGSFFRQQHIVLDDLVVRGFGQDGINFSAFNPTLNSGGFADVAILNSEIHTNGRSGITSSVSSSSGFVVGGSLYDYQSRAHGDFRVAGNVVRHTTGKSESSGVSGNGIVLAQIDGALIERNVAHHNGGIAGGGGVGIWTWEGNDITIQFNEAYQNDSFDGRDGGGFDLDGGVTNSVMQYNYSHGNHGAGLGLFEFGYASPMGGNAIRYNISEGDGGGISVWGAGPRFDGMGTIDRAENSIYHNNTIIRPNGPAVFFFGRVEDVGVYNNVIVTEDGHPAVRLDDWDGPGTDYLVDVEIIGNSYWSSDDPFQVVWGGATYSSLAAWANATGQEKVAGELVGMQVDPLLVGPFTGGLTLDDANLLETLYAYRLSPASPLIDSGVELVTLPLPIALGLTDPGQRDFYGGLIPVRPPDIGAHEVQIAGDFNADGVVDAADYVVWRATVGSTTVLRADANGDRIIDAADYEAWLAGFGNSLSAQRGEANASEVPEPRSASILTFALLLVAARMSNLSSRCS